MKQISPIDQSRFNRGFQIITSGVIATQTYSNAIDTTGYEYALVLISTGTVGAETITIKVSAGTTTTGSASTDISGASTTVVDGDDNIVKWGVVRLHGKARYLFVSHTATAGGVTGCSVACHVVLFNPTDTVSFNAGKANSAAAGSESYSAAAFNVA